MKRTKIRRRRSWRERVEKYGLTFHHTDEGLYWDESAFYSFSSAQVDEMDDAINELHQLCMKVADRIVTEKLYAKLGIPQAAIPLIEESWRKKTPSVYGRFDLVYDGKNPPKMLEYNADTPTSLMEASIIQWYWLEETGVGKDQFNSIHERGIEAWKKAKAFLKPGGIHFAAQDTSEDILTVSYMQDLALQAGLNTKFVMVDHIGLAHDSMVDMQDEIIHNLFKLYPWEFMWMDEIGAKLPILSSKTEFVEPIWKMLISNKGILPLLWEMFPNHPNLLPSYFDSPHGMKSYAKKPLLSREGANVTLVMNDREVRGVDKEYGSEGFVYQEFCSLPNFDGNCPVIGGWVVGGESAGIGIRETESLLTDNFSRFVPHCFD